MARRSIPSVFNLGFNRGARLHAPELIDADLTRHTVSVSSVRNLQECSGPPKRPDLPLAAEGGKFRTSGRKREG